MLASYALGFVFQAVILANAVSYVALKHSFKNKYKLTCSSSIDKLLQASYFKILSLCRNRNAFLLAALKTFVLKLTVIKKFFTQKK